MAQDEPPAKLYDFLYVDELRIASLSAQLFGALLTGLSDTFESDKTTSKTLKGSVDICFRQL